MQPFRRECRPKGHPQHRQGVHERVGNMPPLPSIYPDYMAPIVRTAADAGPGEACRARVRRSMTRRPRERTSSEPRAKTSTSKSCSAWNRQGDDEHSEHKQRPLEALARTGEPVPRSLHVVCRARPDRGLPEANLVRARLGPAAGVLRRRPYALGLRPQDQDRLGGLRAVRFPHDRRQWRGCGISLEGHAGDPHNGGRAGNMDASALGRAKELQRPLPDGSLLVEARGVPSDENAFAPSR